MERKCDHHFKVVFDAIRQLLTPTPDSKKKHKMGFTAERQPSQALAIWCNSRFQISALADHPRFS